MGAAIRQSLVDGVSNSNAEGFRLEGFENMPEALKSMDPLLDVGGSKGRKSAKKARRIALQVMPGSEMLMHFIDLHNEPGLVERPEVDMLLTFTELGEIVLHELVQRMVRLCLACHRSPVPQKWIGSSVALGFEVGPLPERASGESFVRKQVEACIFDWGRSELNTLQKHYALSEAERRDRSKYWSYYVGGVTRLTWEMVRMYWNRFACPKWDQISITVYDFDSLSADDFIGRLSIDSLAPKPVTTDPLQVETLTKVISTSGIPSITYSIEWRSFPADSRLKGAWRIHIKAASQLPRLDKVLLKTTSDPYVEVIAFSEDGNQCSRQRTSVAIGTLNPVWDEVIEFPETISEDSFQTTLNTLGHCLGKDPLDCMLVSDEILGKTSWCGPLCLTGSSERSLTSTSSSPRRLSKGQALRHAFLEWESRLFKAAASNVELGCKYRGLDDDNENPDPSVVPEVIEFGEPELFTGGCWPCQCR